MRNFKTYELVDRKTFETMGEAALTLFNPEALIALDDLRDYLGLGIIVNNWYNGGSLQWRGLRTPEMAAKLGSPRSQHRFGNAFDCTISGRNAEEVRGEIMANKDNPLLIRIMRLEAGVSWVHFDLLAVHDRIRLFNKSLGRASGPQTQKGNIP